MTTMTDSVKAKIIERVPEIVNDTRGFDLEAMSRGGVPKTIGEKEERPITLADVLRAINKPVRMQMMNIPDVSEAVMVPAIDNSVAVLLSKWNLTTDYDNQTQEVKDFIGKLLGV